MTHVVYHDGNLIPGETVCVKIPSEGTVNEENHHIDREKKKSKSNGGEDRYRQAESHEGKLNSLVNVSNQRANLPGIGCLSRTAH